MKKWVLLLLFALVACGGSAEPAGTPTPDIGDEIMARVMCEHFIGEQLVAPATADYGEQMAAFFSAGSLDEIGVTLEELGVERLRNAGVWYASGVVDAENSFGALIRSDYSCVLDYDAAAGDWFLLRSSIE